MDCVQAVSVSGLQTIVSPNFQIQHDTRVWLLQRTLRRSKRGELLQGDQIRTRNSSEASKLRSITIIGGLSLLAFCVLFGLGVHCRNRCKRLQSLENDMWRIPLSEVFVMKRLKHKAAPPRSQSSTSLHSQNTLSVPSILVRGSSVDKKDEASIRKSGGTDNSSLTQVSSATITLGDARDRALWFGRYSGQLVVLKFMPLIERHLKTTEKGQFSKVHRFGKY